MDHCELICGSGVAVPPHKFISPERVSFQVCTHFARLYAVRNRLVGFPTCLALRPTGWIHCSGPSTFDVLTRWWLIRPLATTIGWSRDMNLKGSVSPCEKEGWPSVVTIAAVPTLKPGELSLLSTSRRITVTVSPPLYPGVPRPSSSRC